jgi:hypothetical protein
MKKAMREEYGLGTNQIEASLTLAQMTNAQGVSRGSLLNLHEKGEPIHCSICGAIAPREVHDQSRWAGICEARHRLEMQHMGAARSFPSSSRMLVQSKFREHKRSVR